MEEEKQYNLEQIENLRKAIEKTTSSLLSDREQIKSIDAQISAKKSELSQIDKQVKAKEEEYQKIVSQKDKLVVTLSQLQVKQMAVQKQKNKS